LCETNFFTLTTSFIAAALMTACGDRDPLSSTPGNQTLVSAVIDFQSARVVEPGREWIDNSGLVHLQGRVFEGGVLSGDLSGSIVRSTIAHSTYNPLTGERFEQRIFECQAFGPTKISPASLPAN